eukprot:gene10357-2492_t
MATSNIAKTLLFIIVIVGGATLILTSLSAHRRRYGNDDPCKYHILRAKPNHQEGSPVKLCHRNKTVPQPSLPRSQQRGEIQVDKHTSRVHMNKEHTSSAGKNEYLLSVAHPNNLVETTEEQNYHLKKKVSTTIQTSINPFIYFANKNRSFLFDAERELQRKQRISNKSLEGYRSLEKNHRYKYKNKPVNMLSDRNSDDHKRAFHHINDDDETYEKYQGYNDNKNYGGQNAVNRQADGNDVIADDNPSDVDEDDDDDDDHDHDDDDDETNAVVALSQERLNRIDNDKSVLALKKKLSQLLHEPVPEDLDELLQIVAGAKSEVILPAIISGGSNSSNSRSPTDEALNIQVHTLRAMNRQAVVDTWGPDALFVTHESAPTNRVLKLSPSVEFSGAQAIYSEIYGSSKHQFFLKADDDTYIHRDRLSKMLHMLNPHVPIILGRKAGGPRGFCHGGGGYVLTSGLLNLIGPHLSSVCANIEVAQTWEDLFMRDCISRIMTLGGTGWETCTSQPFMGFDALFFNTKDQDINSKRLEKVLQNDRLWLLTQTSFHSAHSQLARELHHHLTELQDDHRAVNLVDYNMAQQIYRRVRAATWRCAQRSGVVTITRAALCTDPAPLVKVDKFLFKTDICQSTNMWNIISTSTQRFPLMLNRHKDITESRTLSNSIETRHAVLTYVTSGRKATARRFLTILIESLRKTGSNADVIVAVDKADYNPELEQLSLEFSNTAIIMYSRVSVRGISPALATSCINAVICVWTSLLQRIKYAYNRILSVTMDSYFQLNPFEDIDDRSGIVYFLTSPTMTLHAHSYGPWIADVNSKAPQDFLDPTRCLVAVTMLGSGDAMRQALGNIAYLIAQHKKPYVWAFSEHVRLHYAARMFLNATLYNMYDGPAVCLSAERCLFEHSVTKFIKYDENSPHPRFGAAGRLFVTRKHQPVVVNARGDAAAIVSAYAVTQQSGHHKFASEARRRTEIVRQRERRRRTKSLHRIR